MDRHFVPPRPVVSIIMFVDPEKAVHITLIRLEHNATVVLIDPHGTHRFVTLRLGSFRS
jgi:hypothetical protein